MSNQPKYQIIQGDVRTALRDIPDGTVHCCVTSPPYWGLRDYGVAGQIGQEPTPDAYVETMVEVFREVRRVLHDSGTVWLNVGDSYSSGSGGDKNVGTVIQGDGYIQKARKRDAVECMKPKDLCLIPWRLVLALQADGWYVRSVIVWAKKSCMPESVTDRPTNSWEPIFLLAKNARYYYDAEAVKEPASYPEDGIRVATPKNIDGLGLKPTREYGHQTNGTRNQRNVWHLGPENYAEAHFATFPTEIPRRAILAGTSARGCCPKCRAPWVRVVERTVGEDTSWMGRSEKNEILHATGQVQTRGKTLNVGSKEDYYANQPQNRTVGWEPGCECNAGEPVPCTVLDPFSGAATTGLACLKLGRYYLGVELNAAYIALSHKRLADAAMPTLFDAPQPQNGLFTA